MDENEMISEIWEILHSNFSFDFLFLNIWFLIIYVINNLKFDTEVSVVKNSGEI